MDGFQHDGDGGCVAILPADPCPPGQRGGHETARIGQQCDQGDLNGRAVVQNRIAESKSLTTQFPDEPGKRLEDYFAQASNEC